MSLPETPQQMFDLAVAVDQGGHAQNRVEAFALFQRSAELGYLPAMHAVGLAYLFGRGADIAPTRGIEWLTRGAALNDPRCQCALGAAYHEGRGVKRNLPEAFRWYLAAANQGYPEGQYRVGMALLFGHGESKDRRQAIDWIRKAADQGYQKATDRLLELTQTAQTRPEKQRCALVDTQVLMSGDDVVAAITVNYGAPFVMQATIDELDLMYREDPLSVPREAAEIVKCIGSGTTVSLAVLPNGVKVIDGDSVWQLRVDNKPIYVIQRRAFRTLLGVEAGSTEVANDYNLLLLCTHQSRCNRAQNSGAQAVVWERPQQATPGVYASPFRTHATEGDVHYHEPIPAPTPFEIQVSPIEVPDYPLHVLHHPCENFYVSTRFHGRLKLVRVIKSGGEGSIYETDRQHTVCKIYHRDRLSALKERKVELMLSRRVREPGICWPIDVATASEREFVGYVMPMATGRPIQTSLFVRPLFERDFPHWSRVDLVKLCIRFLKRISFLHSINVLVGDINPMNLLVDPITDQVHLVDTDSFQVGPFPCPVGTVNFTAPEIQGTSYRTFMRTMEHELFAVATMLFMILLPGKAPFAQQGGGDPEENIRRRMFPYTLNGAGANAPKGPWQSMWRALPESVRAAFVATFTHERRTSLEAWIEIMTAYLAQISEDHHSDTLIFPRTWPREESRASQLAPEEVVA